MFDCEELLESSILSLRNSVDHVWYVELSELLLTLSVVYQTTSNFGDPGNPHILEFLEYLQEKSLIDSLACWREDLHWPSKKVFYQPKTYSEEEREHLITDTNPTELGGPKFGVGNQFLDEGMPQVYFTLTSQLPRENLDDLTAWKMGAPIFFV